MSNMLRGSLTSTTDAKGVLGFKGERGYSNYEIYVKNGGTMTEQEWLDHFGVDLTGYVKTTDVLDLVYPVGSIYISVSNTNPSTLFGGTWVQIKDTFLLSAGDSYTAGNTGGEASHTLTTRELPSGILGVNATNSNFLQELNGMDQGSAFGWLGRNHTHTPESINNMPPYLVVYVWKRTE